MTSLRKGPKEGRGASEEMQVAKNGCGWGLGEARPGGGQWPLLLSWRRSVPVGTASFPSASPGRWAVLSVPLGHFLLLVPGPLLSS